MSNEIEVGGVVYRYTANVKNTKDGMTQHIEVSIMTKGTSGVRRTVLHTGRGKTSTPHQL